MHAFATFSAGLLAAYERYLNSGEPDLVRDGVSYSMNALAAVRAPVLAITGEKEIQVDPADLARMAELVPGDFESHLVSGLTHLLRADADGPGLKTYKQQVRRPVDDHVIQYVLTWLKERTRGHRQRA